MTIEDRNLAAGTVLVGRYRGQPYECTVLESDGVKAYALADGSIHSSLSAAASKLMDGGSVNGWRFWSLVGAADARPTPPKTPPSKLVKVIKRVPNQKAVVEGSTKWWCSQCMKGFVAEGTVAPDTCPEGHGREVPDEFGGVAKDGQTAE